MDRTEHGVNSLGVAAIAVVAGVLVMGPRVAAAEPAPVRVAEVVAAVTAETLRLTGTVTARQRAGLSPRTSGLVRAVHVDAGDVVDAGEVLLELDGEVAALELRRAEAALREGRVQLTEARRLLREAEPLVRDEHLPETELHARAAEVDLRAAAMARLEAEVGHAREALARHSLVAPFAGVVSRKRTEAGEWVETGTPVLDLVDIEHLRLDVQVPQERFADIDLDTPVEVRPDGTSAEPLPARVGARVPVNDPVARTFLVRVEVSAAHGRLLPGMSAQAIFEIPGASSAVSVPRDALLRGADGSFSVWSVEGSENEARAAAREVTLGRTLAEQVEVIGGLRVGELVVVRGNEALREGQRVRFEARDNGAHGGR